MGTLYRVVSNPVAKISCDKRGGEFFPCGFHDVEFGFLTCGCRVPGEIYAAKPVLYLYPKEVSEVQVTVDYKTGFYVTYPEYKDGWNVVAYPDGTLINKNDGREYSYLFWEGNYDSDMQYDLSSGFVVRGVDTVDFLQNVLSKIGLTPKEYNEFIVYWYPKMLKNQFNLIHFATKSEYNDKVLLKVYPEPDSILRVFMVYKSLEKPVDVEQQHFVPFNREGFTVIEWGGSELR